MLSNKQVEPFEPKKLEFREPEVTKCELIEQIDDFEIPSMPYGRNLEIHIQSTWGDPYYVGLSGLEFFDNEGNQIKVEEIKAYPPDINILPGYGDDPWTIDKLIDGTYFTKDDLHVWLAPFTPGNDHQIKVDFGKAVTLSMIWVWNYNKSRIHSFWGVQ